MWVPQEINLGTLFTPTLCLLEFHSLATYKITSGQEPTCDCHTHGNFIVLHHIIRSPLPWPALLVVVDQNFKRKPLWTMTLHRVWYPKFDVRPFLFTHIKSIWGKRKSQITHSMKWRRLLWRVFRTTWSWDTVQLATHSLAYTKLQIGFCVYLGCILRESLLWMYLVSLPSDTQTHLIKVYWFYGLAETEIYTQWDKPQDSQKDRQRYAIGKKDRER